MKAIIQRVNESSVSVNNQVIGQIKKGYCILVGFSIDDTEEKIPTIAEKILKLRIFDDQEGNMNLDINEVKGSILLISNFTLYADTHKGNRPSFKESLNFNESKILYDKLIAYFKEKIDIQTGEFGADMEVLIKNDGPVTITIEV